MKPTTKQPKMSKARSTQRIAHTIDNIGGRDLPHAVIHNQDVLKSKTLQEAKDHAGRTGGHLDEAVHQSGMLSEAIKMVPGVLKEGQRLAKIQTQSDGLVQDQSSKKPAVIMPVKKSPGLAKFAATKKLMASAMSKGAK